uniref:Uncharacterized protein n=1 Tax=Hyaloperonospora arabidopsidis (strain Emoy2) TaxID=559515 RepID=M4BTZ1_HYAAE
MIDSICLSKEIGIRAKLIRTLNFAIPYCKRDKHFYRQLISLKVKFIHNMLYIEVQRCRVCKASSILF